MGAMPGGLNKEMGRCARALTHTHALHTLTAHLLPLFEATDGRREPGLATFIRICQK